MLKKMTVLMLLFVCVFSASAMAKPQKESKPSATERVGDEVADAVADVLTGDDSGKAAPSKGVVPPGLAKKDKVPPGWSKGEKTGWDKASQEESPIKRFFKNLFSKKS
jgi:hypothetical protein